MSARHSSRLFLGVPFSVSRHESKTLFYVHTTQRSTEHRCIFKVLVLTLSFTWFFTLSFFFHTFLWTLTRCYERNKIAFECKSSPTLLVQANTHRFSFKIYNDFSSEYLHPWFRLTHSLSDPRPSFSFPRVSPCCLFRTVDSSRWVRQTAVFPAPFDSPSPTRLTVPP